MVSRMTLRVQRPDLPAAETEAVLVTGLDDAPGIDRHDIAV
jgi:hypothetical protein